MKQKCIIFIAICIAYITPTYPQTGPGGVKKSNGATSLVLWLDASELTDIANNNNITTWTDLSGYNNHATQSASGSKPNLSNNTLNGLPVVTFNGSSEYLNGNFGGPIVSPYTVFAIAFFNQASQPMNDNDYVFSTGLQNITGQMASISRRKNVASPLTNDFYSYDGTNTRFGPDLGGSTWYIFNQEILDNSLSTHRLFLNGTSEVVEDYISELNSSGDFRVGGWVDSPTNDFQDLLNGSIAELIVFNGSLNTSERLIVTSYLSAKYNIPISTDLYTGDDISNGDNDFDIIGVGVGFDGSQENSTGAGLSVTINSNFDVGDYLVGGHNVNDNSINTSDISVVSGTLEARWDRAWWLDLTDTGNSLTVDLSFDFNLAGFGGFPTGDITDYKLLYRNGVSGDWTVTTEMADISGDKIVFENVNFSTTGDGYYTVGTADLSNSPIGIEPTSLGSDGPGGVGAQDGSTNLKLWLDVNEIIGNTGDPVITWLDKSGNENTASEGAEFPHLETSSVNGNNALTFDGSTDFLSGTISGGLSAPSTIIAIANFNSDQGASDNDYVLSIGASSVAGDHTSISRRLSGGGNQNKYYSWDGANARITTDLSIIPTSTWNILGQTQNTVAPRHIAYLDGSAIPVDDFSTNFSSNGVYSIGKWNLATNSYLNGQVAEVIIYDKILNSAEFNIINSYLAAKFELSPPNDKYIGDELANGDHDLDVAGIGTEFDGTNATASSAGMRLEQNNGFEDGDYVMFGHKTPTNKLNDIDATDAGGVLEARWERVWWVDITDTSTPLSIDLTFDFSSAGIDVFPRGMANKYKLLYRSGISGDWDLLADGTTISGDAITFTGISLSADGYYTLGTIDKITNPLPVELLYFEAKLNERNQTELEWSTAIEVNNDFFVVERSTDGLSFESIIETPGAGSSNTEIVYKAVDSNTLTGISYYRLKQVDYDGGYQFSKIKRIENHLTYPETPFVVYPNPAHNMIKIRSNENQEVTILVINQLGTTVAEENVIMDKNEDTILDLPIVTEGYYLIKFLTNDQTFTKRLLIVR